MNRVISAKYVAAVLLSEARQQTGTLGLPARGFAEFARFLKEDYPDSTLPTDENKYEELLNDSDLFVHCEHPYALCYGLTDKAKKDMLGIYMTIPNDILQYILQQTYSFIGWYDEMHASLRELYPEE